MEYKPVAGVWEITGGCNMQCKHCGFGNGEPLADELTSIEALALCGDLAALGLKSITLSGGEPFMRRDWPLLVKELANNGVTPNIITNARLITEDLLDTAKANNVGSICVSLDGLEDTHDYLRENCSFRQVVSALKMIKDKGIVSGVLTTISRKNIAELTAMKNVLVKLGAGFWQFQIALPQGHFNQQLHLVMDPWQIDRVIDFTYEAMIEGGINIHPSDCLGYFNHKEFEVRRNADNSAALAVWKGCNAGKRSLGIRPNGDVTGCTYLRDKQFVEGNVRQRPLREIWDDSDCFGWNRNMTKERLTGRCKVCKYGSRCLGGCAAIRFAMNDRMDSENQFCSYNVAVRKKEKDILGIDDFNELVRLGKEHANKKEFQLAEVVLQQALDKEPANIPILAYYGYVHLFLGNYPEAMRANRKVLEKAPEHIYANSGMGMVLHRSGQTEKGIEYLKKAVELADVANMSPYKDLTSVYLETGRITEAKVLQEKARELAPDWVATFR